MREQTVTFTDERVIVDSTRKFEVTVRETHLIERGETSRLPVKLGR